MSERPRPLEGLPAGNGHSGPRPRRPRRPTTAPAGCLPILANRWAVILRRFRDLLARMERFALPPGQSAHHVEALSRGEVRVLHYL